MRAPETVTVRPVPTHQRAADPGAEHKQQPGRGQRRPARSARHHQPHRHRKLCRRQHRPGHTRDAGRDAEVRQGPSRARQVAELSERRGEQNRGQHHPRAEQHHVHAPPTQPATAPKVNIKMGILAPGPRWLPEGPAQAAPLARRDDGDLLPGICTAARLPKTAQPLRPPGADSSLTRCGPDKTGTALRHRGHGAALVVDWGGVPRCTRNSGVDTRQCRWRSW
jgi:hypothetical protein